MDKVDCVVIGAGVIGLAIARRLAQAGREVIVLEAAEGIGTVTSSRNSEVIHAGIYYRANSLMAQMCVSGKHALYQILPRPRHPASQLRQADRRDDSAGNRKTAIDPRACRSQRRRRSATAPGRSRPRAGAGAELRCGPVVAVHRHHRQPRLHAGAAGRCGRRRCCFRVSYAAAARPGQRRPHRNRNRRRRADDAGVQPAGQFGRTGCDRGGAQHRWHAGRADSFGLSGQGQLFQLQCAVAVFTPDLSGAGARRARACT